MNHEKQFTIVGLGEILWDLLPDGKKLGGAPTNFAYHAMVLGNRALPVSRIGEDSLGQEIRSRLEELGIPDNYIQADPEHPTGTVEVELDEQGHPTFTIIRDVAWDFLEWTPELEELASDADAVCFGCLAQRSSQSRETIRRFLKATRKNALRICDINLRQSFYSSEMLTDSLSAASLLKLNDEEMTEVLSLLNLEKEGGEKAACCLLLEEFNLEMVCLTRGARGSLLVTLDEAAENPGYPVTVADTVGSGDAFTAVLCHHYLREAPLQKISETTNRYGSWVATQAGGTPSVPDDVLQEVVL